MNKNFLIKILKRTSLIIFTVIALFIAQASQVFATDDPLTVINNLSTFIFGVIRAIGMILLGWGIVQVGLALKSHDASQRENGFLTLAGGIIITFSKQTNVETTNRLICYDIIDLGEQLLPIGMLVILDSILNRISKNRKSGKRTYIFIDEIYLLFKYEYTTNFVYALWKRIRKYGGCATGITQNIEEILNKEKSSTMLSNSELIIMLNQSATDREKLAKFLNISDIEKVYITNVDSGEGLIRVRNSLIPFKNKFPKDTELYKLMTTKLEEQNYE